MTVIGCSVGRCAGPRSAAVASRSTVPTADRTRLCGQRPNRGGVNPRADAAAVRLVTGRPGSLAWSPRQPPADDPSRDGRDSSEEQDMTGRWVTRWVATPLLELGYLVLGLFAGVATGSVAVTFVALSIGLLPAFLLGLPMVALTVYVVHGLAVMERARAAATARGRPARPPAAAGPGRRLGAPHPGARSVASEFWKETAYAVLLLPFGTVYGHRWRSPSGRPLPRRSLLPLYARRAARRRGSHLAALVSRARGRGRLRGRRAAAAARPAAHRGLRRRAPRPGARRCWRRATPTPCGAGHVAAPRPAPGSSTPPTPSAAGSSATCTTAPSSSWSRWR